MSSSNFFARRMESVSQDRKGKYAFALFLCVLIVATCTLYWRFIFCDDVLIYSGVGSDSIGQTVPFLLNEADRLESGDFSSWNQFQFLGGVTLQLLNPDYLPALLGTSTVSTMMLVSQMLKIILAGVFFYFFLAHYDIGYKTRFAVALGIALCGRMIELAPWTAYTLEITLSAYLLWAFERFFSCRRHVVALPVAFAMIGLSEGVYGFVLYGCVLVAYAVFRVGYSWDETWNVRRAAIFSGTLLLLLGAAVLMSLPITLPSIEMYGTSPRVGSNLSSAFSFLYLFVPSNMYICAEEVLKFFSNGVLGHMDSYRGMTSILDSPYFYCGVLSIVALPFCFVSKKKHEKIWLAIILAAVAFYCYSEGARFVLNGFSTAGDSFRQSSSWVVLVTGLTGAMGLEALWNLRRTRGLLLWGLVLVAAIVVSAIVLQARVYPQYIALSIVSVCFYVVAFSIRASRKEGGAGALAMAILTLVAMPVELVCQDYRAVNHATHLTVEDYQAQLGTDPEDTVIAASHDVEDTYRIDYKTLMLTRGMADTYLSTQAYIGGAAIAKPMNDYLKTLRNDYVAQSGYSRYCYGFNDQNVNTLLGVKYIVYPNDGVPYYVPFGYSEVARTSTYIVLENDYALPLIFGYRADSTISEEEYDTMEPQERSAAMLSRCVIDSGNGGADPVLAASANDGRLLAQSSEIATAENGVILQLSPSDSEWLDISMQLNATASVSGSVTIQIDLLDDSGNLVSAVPYYTAGGNEPIDVQVRNKGFSMAKVRIVATNACDDAAVSGVVVSECSDHFFDSYISSVESRISGAPEVSEYKGGKLDGSIKMEDDGYLATSIPWSSRWEVRIDGKPVESQCVNVGFVGAKVPAGQHEVELIYDNTLQDAGVMLAGLTFVLLMSVSMIMRFRARGGMGARHKPAACPPSGSPNSEMPQ